ncbi:MAG: ribosome rescue protein RqcH [Candidatus Nezhaarchaeales archaeon]
MSKVKLKPKNSLSALDLRALIKEMTPIIVEGIIVNVYMIEDVLMLKIRCRDGVTRLLTIKLPYWVSLSKYDIEKPPSPPIFCKLLRKYLRRSKIIELEQVGFDRILKIKVKSREETYELIIELVREGNIILCDQNSVILGAYREIEFKDRSIKKKLKYQLPPNVISEPSEERASKVLSELRKPNAFYFAFSLVGSPEVAYEILARSGIDPEEEISNAKADVLKRILDEANKVIKALNSLRPSIVYIDGKPFSVIPIEFTIYNGYERKVYNSFHEAVADFFYEVLKESISKREKEVLEKEEKRIRASIEELKRHLNEIELKSNSLRRVIALLQEKYESFQELLDSFKKSWLRGEDKPRDLKKIEGVEVLDVNLKEKTVTLNVEGARLSLKPHESLMANISRLYDELKELKRKIDAGNKALRELEDKLAKIIKDKSVIVEEIEDKIRVRREPRHWYERFLWFKSSDGFLVIGGKDATQNEVLVKKYLGDKDLFFHADITGASAVIVKTEGREIPQTTISEAAQFAACYSKAWKAGFGSIDVYWVYGEQVSKTPPSGEYLPKGSFMIRGTRNYLRGVELKLAIGLTITENEIFIVSGPPSAIAKQAFLHLVLVPGDDEKVRIANRIAKIFNEKLCSMGFENINIRSDDVMKVMPPGRVKIVSKVSKEDVNA